MGIDCDEIPGEGINFFNNNKTYLIIKMKPIGILGDYNRQDYKASSFSIPKIRQGLRKFPEIKGHDLEGIVEATL